MKAGTHSVHLKWMTDEDKLLAGVEINTSMLSRRLCSLCLVFVYLFLFVSAACVLIVVRADASDSSTQVRSAGRERPVLYPERSQ